MSIKKLLKFSALVFLIAVMNMPLNAQEKAEEDHSYKPLTLKLSEDGKKYIRFIMWHQIWVTSNNLSAENSKFGLSTSIRRSRFLAYAQISPKFLILSHWGLNSLDSGNLTSLGNNGNAPQLFLHGAWGELKLNNNLYVGGGLHYWKGLTRLSNQSTLNFMTLDQSRPFVAWHSLGITDQFARHLGVYAKGEIGNFDYRFAVNTPLKNNISGDYSLKGSDLTYTGVINPDSDGNLTGNMILEGYFRYNFWDKESTKLPYQVGTYLGKKRVFGIGAGFFAHPNGMFNSVSGEHVSVTHWAVDAFLDMPLGEKGALNAYLAYMNFNYGENYVARWAGTGTAIYGQLGYYLNSAKIMPYVAYNMGNYEGMNDPITALDVGLNYFINGHFAKLTLEYHQISGDVREGAIATQADALSQMRLQLHIFL